MSRSVLVSPAGGKLRASRVPVVLGSGQGPPRQGKERVTQGARARGASSTARGRLHPATRPPHRACSGAAPRGRNHVTKDVIIKSTHRGLRYEDGRVTGVLEAGRPEGPEGRQGRLGGPRPRR